MKPLIPRTMTAASMVALALVASGCGGSSHTPPQAPPPKPATVDMAMVTEDGAGYMAPEVGEFTIAAGGTVSRGSVTFTCAAGGGGCMVVVAADHTVTSTGGMVTATNSTAYRTALDNAMKIAALSDLEGSTRALTTLAKNDVTAAGSAKMMARKYSAMIGALGSDGDSLAAAMNARKVLDARTMLQAARTGAETKKAAATAARTGLADDDPFAALLDGAISRAGAQVETAGTVLQETGRGSLKSWVEMVTGTDAGNRKTPADRGKEVARAVAMALGPTTTGGANPDGAGLRVVHGTALPGQAVGMANRYRTNDSTGRTFAMIVGTGNLVQMRIGTGVSGSAATRPVMATSFAGMPAASITSGTPGAGDVADGREYGGPRGAGANYKGIPGVVFCAGACKVEEVSGTDTLTGSWYFAPANPMARYMTTAGEVTYVPDTMYAIYGHWLAVQDGEGDGALGVNTFARVGGDADGAPDNPGSWVAAIPAHGDAGMRMSTATWRGGAAGRSVHRTIDADGQVADLQSGRFEADVMLTAKFGASPMLGGTIDNFRAAKGSNPGAVDTSWTVRLMETGATGGTVEAADGGAGVAAATGQNGRWSATSYGASAAGATGDTARRPVGIYGGFNAHFTDGHVAGAYARGHP